MIAKAQIIPDNPYLLLTPGPLSTSAGVRAALLRDWCTWDDDYNNIVESIRRQIVSLATSQRGYTSVLMQGSGTFCVEATLSSVISKDEKVLVLSNGAYGQRIEEICQRCRINHCVLNFGELHTVDPEVVKQTLLHDTSISHVAVVHCETTTGMLNPIEQIAKVVSQEKRQLILDAMSSFGGIPLDIGKLSIDYLISSANKCIQGVPGFGFVIAKKSKLEKCKGNAQSLSLDLYDQWKTMEEGQGKWRFTSPTHVVRAFAHALDELSDEGGIPARYERYMSNQKKLVKGMQSLGFTPLLPMQDQSPIITAFYNPDSSDFDFKTFYTRLKKQGFVIYPGKVSEAPCFRIGTIGEVFPMDIDRLLTIVSNNRYWLEK